MSPQLKSVEAAGKHALIQKKEPYKIFPAHFFSQTEGVKSTFARIINCTEPDRIAVIASVSYGIATVAKNVQIEEGQEILILKDQFPSNYYAWQRLAKEKGAQLKSIEVEEGPDKGDRWNKAILNAIGSKTAIVAVSHVHWAEGVLFDLENISEKCKSVGAWLVVDGTQSVGALPFDIQKIKPDALICAAYKWLMGPYSTAIAYYGLAMDDGVPLEENWINRKDSQDFRNLVNYQDDYQPGAGRYCVGQQSNFILMPMLETALQQIYHWNPINIQTYCKELSEPYLERLIHLGFQVLPPSQRANHLICLGLPEGVEMEKLQQKLADQKIVVSVRGNSIRIAPNVYNDSRDWDRLMAVLLDFNRL